jgi:hypothetical protein
MIRDVLDVLQMTENIVRSLDNRGVQEIENLDR